LVGKWDSSFKAINEQTKEEIILWKATPRPEGIEKEYTFSHFTKQLNYLFAEAVPHLAPTDSRFRPDQRALEYGDRNLAADEKHRLEEKQRARRKDMKEANESHVPRWFEEKADSITGEKYYKYKGGYIEAHQAKHYSDVIDIFT